MPDKEPTKEPDVLDEYLAEAKEEPAKPPAKVEATPKADAKPDPTELLMTEILKVQQRAIIRGSALDALAESGEVSPPIFESAVRANDARMVKEMCIVFGVTAEEFYDAYALEEEDEEDEEDVEEDEEEEEEEEAPPTPQAKAVPKKKKKELLDEEFIK